MKKLICILLLVFSTNSFADNPCGRACTQKLVENAVARAIAVVAGNLCDVNCIQQIVNAATAGQLVVSADKGNSIKKGTDKGAYFSSYEKIAIWAEEGIAFSANKYAWSYGNGAMGAMGITLPENWELYAITFNCVVGSGNLNIKVMNVDENKVITIIKMKNLKNNFRYTQVLAQPIALSAGTTLGFKNATVTGVVKNGRITAWLRRHPD